jgi:hypothetical protein
MLKLPVIPWRILVLNNAAITPDRLPPRVIALSSTLAA